jgi:predicted nucleic acid-binding protein
MTLPLLDTNIFLRHLLADHTVQSPKATAYLARIERGELRARTTEIVVFETVFNLQRWYKRPKAEIRNALLPLIELPGIVLPGKRRLRETFDLYITLNLPFADAYHVVVMKQLKLTEVVSFDREFDRVPDINRIEPFGPCA